ncbi:MAG TPA: hypothetical protein PKY10_16625, partial [Lentisphaeria bacterium]|nr:hypothetical protein [Lentisphaeria bacterium]
TYAVKVGNTAWHAEPGVQMLCIDDENGNGMPDWFESFYGVSDAAADADNDGLNNLYEYLCGTDPTDEDNGTTDADTVLNTGVTVPNTLTNAEKQQFGLDPRLDDSDGDGITDYEEVYGTVAGMFPRPDRDSFSSDPLNPISQGGKPALKYLTFTGTGLNVPVQAKHALASWTIMTWVRPTVASAATLVKREVAENVVNYELGWTVNGGQLWPYVSFRSATGQEVKAAAQGAAALIPTDAWTHLAATYDDETYLLTLYINGMPVAQTENKGKITCPIFGSGVFGGVVSGVRMTLGNGFVGDLDNLRIYGYALKNGPLENDYRTATAANNSAAQPYAATTGGYRTNSMSV